jgi:hypothetical protein
VEDRLWYRFDDGRPAFSGQVDYAVVQERRGLAIDYKTGSSPVVASRENYQMRAQAVLLARAFALEEVYVAIVQPLAERPVTVALYRQEELKLAELDLLFGLQLAHSDEPERTPGERQCRYCRGRSICPENQEGTVTFVPAPLVQIDRLNEAVAVPALNGEQLAELLPKIEIAEKVIREIRRQAKAVLENDPTAIGGYRLKPGAARRVIVDPREAFSRLASVLSPEEFAACCSVQIGRLEETFRRATGESSRDAREMLAEILGDAVEKRSVDPTLERRDPTGNPG